MESVVSRVRALPARWWLGARRPEAIVLGVLSLAGLALRIYFFDRWRPGLVGFPDTLIYVQDARIGIFNDPLHVGGYSEFLRLLHGIRPHLSFVIAVQHALGVWSGLLLYGAAVRAGLPRAVALVPAAFVLLGGSEIFVEHAVLSEAVFIFLADLALYAIVRAWKGSWAWAALAGLALGAAADVRTVGLILLIVLGPVGALLLTAPWRARLLRALVVIAAAAAPVSAYLIEHQDVTGYGGFTGAGYFDLYARVAPFADCSKFHPPQGTGRLCIHIPRSQRLGHDYWEFTAISPAVRVFGEPDLTAAAAGREQQAAEVRGGRDPRPAARLPGSRRTRPRADRRPVLLQLPLQGERRVRLHARIARLRLLRNEAAARHPPGARPVLPGGR